MDFISAVKFNFVDGKYINIKVATLLGFDYRIGCSIFINHLNALTL